jgi:DNA-binding NtrC family response regulator
MVPRLLLVEDDADTLLAMAMLMKARGFDVRTSNTTEDACAKLDVERFDLVLADLTLGPTMDRERSWRDVATLVQRSRPARVGLVSGWEVSEALAAQHQLAFALRKPFDLDALFAAIGRFTPTAPAF